MSESRLRRNKNKGAYRMLFLLFVVCLVVYFWLFVAESLNQNTGKIVFCFIFLVGGSVILAWQMKQEPDLETDQVESEKTKIPKSTEDS